MVQKLIPNLARTWGTIDKRVRFMSGRYFDVMHLVSMNVAMVFFLWLPLTIMVLVVWMLHQWPPHAANMLYGYRTPRSMASVEAWNHAQDRCFELMKGWTWWMACWTPLIWWRWGSDTGVMIMHGLLTVGVCLPLFFVERELRLGAPFSRQGGIHLLAGVFTLMVLASVFRPITHDGSEPERDVVGTVESFRWDAVSRDVRIRLTNDPCGYYINRGLDMGIDSTRWSASLTDQVVTLQVVDRPAGLNWFGRVGPVRGLIWGQDTLYRTGVVSNPQAAN